MSSINAIELHVRTYHSALKSSLEVTIHSLTNSYLKIDSILHPLARDPIHLDPSAIVYSLLRLPKSIDKSKTVIMAQSPRVFSNFGFTDINQWQKVSSPARRRTSFFNPKTGIFAALISSTTDLDDLVNLLIAYQIEWNKFHQLATTTYPTYPQFKKAILNNSDSTEVLKTFGLNLEDWQKIKTALGRNWRLRLKRMYSRSQNLRLRLLAGSWIDYTKTTQQWWKNISQNVSPTLNLSHQNVYFISSNAHSFLNIITGFALKSEKKLLKFAPKNYQQDNPYLPPQDFLYYLSKFFDKDKSYQSEWQKIQKKLGIFTIPSAHHLDVNAQIFPISSLTKSKHLDPRLKISKTHKIERSNALIFNIDYPLGFTAYHVLNKVLENVSAVKGVYILGKAAVLNSEIGDLQVPRLVFDEHSQNSYFFKNCFNTYFPFTNSQGSILTHQKSVSVYGTFLENESLLKKYSQNNLTVIEMENGPYLSAITEATYDQQTPRGTMVDLNSAPFDIGIINYTSDTPYSKAKNLGAGSLNLAGVEPVYLGSLAILQRIIELEEHEK